MHAHVGKFNIFAASKYDVRLQRLIRLVGLTDVESRAKKPSTLAYQSVWLVYSFAKLPI